MKGDSVVYHYITRINDGFNTGPYGSDDSEFDFRTAMNIWGKLRERHIWVEKAKESTEKSKHLKKIVMKSRLLRKITRERIKRDMMKIK